MKETFELIFWSALNCSIFCMGVYAVFSKGMLLGFVSNWLEKHEINKNVLKPLIWCPTCMSSVWGTLFFCLALAGQIGLFWWLPFVIMVAGINFVISQVIYE